MLIVRHRVVTQDAADPPEGVGEAAAGLLLGELGPEDAGQDGAGVRMVAEGDEIGQQVTGLLGGQLNGLPVPFDSQSAKGVEM
jgi:hypothetical protein